MLTSFYVNNKCNFWYSTRPPIEKTYKLTSISCKYIPGNSLIVSREILSLLCRTPLSARCSMVTCNMFPFGSSSWIHCWIKLKLDCCTKGSWKEEQNKVKISFLWFSKIIYSDQLTFDVNWHIAGGNTISRQFETSIVECEFFFRLFLPEITFNKWALVSMASAFFSGLTEGFFQIFTNSRNKSVLEM